MGSTGDMQTNAGSGGFVISPHPSTPPTHSRTLCNNPRQGGFYVAPTRLSRHHVRASCVVRPSTGAMCVLRQQNTYPAFPSPFVGSNLQMAAWDPTLKELNAAEVCLGTWCRERLALLCSPLSQTVCVLCGNLGHTRDDHCRVAFQVYRRCLSNENVS